MPVLLKAKPAPMSAYCLANPKFTEGFLHFMAARPEGRDASKKRAAIPVGMTAGGFT